ncbi:HEXXH motif domain-containing protein [Pelagibacterium lacus]|uniref:HEXXH motif domain-containing protein n=2 Tax=Pelagibacterium lacus TaxID=2282655 RepID=A0A369W037_9HYPH|nr:HEXXH motif domain-containing protein [Pelagibacterium lacus]
MHAELASSLAYLADEARGHFDVDTTGLATVIEGLKAERFEPITFERYYQLVAAMSEGRLAEAKALFDAICAARPMAPGLTIASIDDIAGPDGAALIRSAMDTDPTTRFSFLQPPADMAEAFRSRLDRAWARFEPVVPELFAEVRAVIGQVVLAVGEPGGTYHFDGGSSYRLWGALVLNPSFHPTEMDVVEVIGHESGHTLLFGHSIDEPLVFNPDDELFKSPLRLDPRPMDGIFHATFVLARMHWTMSKLIDSGLLTAEEAAHAEEARQSDARLFHDGLQTVRASARLSGSGARLIDAAEAYMAQATRA